MHAPILIDTQLVRLPQGYSTLARGIHYDKRSLTLRLSSTSRLISSLVVLGRSTAL